MPLFPYQVQGVTFLERKKGRALIADEMGLGKTIQALGWLNHRKSARPVIVVCPLSVRLNWQREVSKWVAEESYLPYGQTPDPGGYAGQPFIIIHYGVLPFWVPWLKTLGARVLVVDEAHLIKTNSALRTKAVKALAKGIPHVIGLTGTPIVNRPIEAFNILAIINRDAIPNWRTYTMRYCAPKFNGFGWDYNGASNTQELHEKLVSTIVLRRRKEDVLDLPPKMRSFIPLPLSNQSEYNAAEDDLISYLKLTEGKDAAQRAARSLDLVKVSKLRMLAAQGKLDQMIEWIGETIEHHKLVVFAIHREILDPIYKKFGDVAVKIAGDVSEKDRLAAIDRFQTDPRTKLFVGQVQAAGTGITLTAACHVAFLELPWTPAEVLQAEDRCHRIGQNQPVLIYYLLAANTIDEKMAQLIDRKRSVVNAVIDGSVNATPVILRELLALYKRGNNEGVRHFNPSESGRKVRSKNGTRLARALQ